MEQEHRWEEVNRDITPDNKDAVVTHRMRVSTGWVYGFTTLRRKSWGRIEAQRDFVFVPDWERQQLIAGD